MRPPAILPDLELENVPDAPQELTYEEGIGWIHCWAYVHQSEDYRQHMIASIQKEFPFLTANDPAWDTAVAAILGRVAS